MLIFVLSSKLILMVYIYGLNSYNLFTLTAPLYDRSQARHRTVKPTNNKTFKKLKQFKRKTVKYKITTMSRVLR